MLKFYHLFLPALLKKLPVILTLFSHYYVPIILIQFFCINVSGTYWHIEKQELDMYRFCCRYMYIVQTLVTQVQWSMKVILAFSLNWLISHVTVCHWFLYLIGADYSFIMPLKVLKFKNCACECPMVPRIMPAKLITYNFRNYASTL